MLFIKNANDTPSSTNKECSSQPECKWFQIDTTTYKLLECEGISNSENKYYTKEISRDGQYYCRLLGINGFPNKKIIDGTTQIIKSCQDLGLYELGDKCFHSIPNNAEVSNTNTKEFKCKYKNYIKNQDKGLNYYICLNENEDCPNEFKYYDPEKKECLYNCPSNKQRISIIEKSGKIYYQCTSKCNIDGYDKEYSKNSYVDENTIINYCYKKCLQEAPYYYQIGSTKKCYEKCSQSSKDFYFEEDGKCASNLAECNNKYFLINSKIKYYICKNEEFISCPSNYPYNYIYNEKTFFVYRLVNILNLIF